MPAQRASGTRPERTLDARTGRVPQHPPARNLYPRPCAAPRQRGPPRAPAGVSPGARAGPAESGRRTIGASGRRTRSAAGGEGGGTPPSERIASGWRVGARERPAGREAGRERAGGATERPSPRQRAGAERRERQARALRATRSEQEAHGARATRRRVEQNLQFPNPPFQRL